MSLRRWRLGDAAALSRLVGENLEHLRPWMPWVQQEPLTLVARLKTIRAWESQFRSGGDLWVGVFLGGHAIGAAGLRRRRGPEALEIGYWIRERFTGCGYATRSASLLSDLAFSMPGIARVEIHHDRANTASGRVAARAGFIFSSQDPVASKAPGESGVECTWILSRGRWMEMRGTQCQGG